MFAKYNLGVKHSITKWEVIRGGERNPLKEGKGRSREMVRTQNGICW